MAILYVHGSAEFLYSREGVTQGDPLSLFYAMGILPLIQLLKEPIKWTQIWYADDASACGELYHIHEWFDLLLHHGPLYGYYPNPSKCYAVVDPSCHDCAVEIFSPLSVQVVTSYHFLGGFLGTLLQEMSLSVASLRYVSGSLMLLIWPS